MFANVWFDWHLILLADKNGNHDVTDLTLKNHFMSLRIFVVKTKETT